MRRAAAPSSHTMPDSEQRHVTSNSGARSHAFPVGWVCPPWPQPPQAASRPSARAAGAIRRKMRMPGAYLILDATGSSEHARPARAARGAGGTLGAPHAHMRERVMKTLWIVALLVACGTPGPSPADPANRTAAEEGRAGDPAGLGPPGGSTSAGRPPCPPTFDSPGPRCEGENPGDCSYPEGECYCGSPSSCSGAEQPPLPPRWICEARVVCGAAGTPCTPGSPSCGSPCCGGATSCIRGVWVDQLVPCPP